MKQKRKKGKLSCLAAPWRRVPCRRRSPLSPRLLDPTYSVRAFRIGSLLPGTFYFFMGDNNAVQECDRAQLLCSTSTTYVNVGYVLYKYACTFKNSHKFMWRLQLQVSMQLCEQHLHVGHPQLQAVESTVPFTTYFTLKPVGCVQGFQQWHVATRRHVPVPAGGMACWSVHTRIVMASCAGVGSIPQQGPA